MRFTKIVLCGAIISLFTLSCEDDSSRFSDANDLSDVAKAYLKMKAGTSMNSMNGFSSGTGNANPVNESFQRLYSNSGRSTSGRTNDTISIDTTFIRPYQWVSCAVVTVVNNPDNSVTTSYDYGDGCYEGYQDYKYFMKGKYTYTYRSGIEVSGSVRKDSYFYEYRSENYGGKYFYAEDTTEWLSNGHSTSSGTSEYDELKNTYKGHYNWEGDDTYIYDGIEYSYTGGSKTYYNERKSVIEASESTSRNGDNYYYNLVLKPLVMDYSCNPFESGFGSDSVNPAFYCYYVPIYISGREFIRYKQDGQEGSFIIDWGNGECDTKFTIEENGKLMKIDWAKADAIFNK